MNIIYLKLLSHKNYAQYYKQVTYLSHISLFSKALIIVLENNDYAYFHVATRTWKQIEKEMNEANKRAQRRDVFLVFVLSGERLNSKILWINSLRSSADFQGIIYIYIYMPMYGTRVTAQLAHFGASESDTTDVRSTTVSIVLMHYLYSTILISFHLIGFRAVTCIKQFSFHLLACRWVTCIIQILSFHLLFASINC